MTVPSASREFMDGLKNLCKIISGAAPSMALRCRAGRLPVVAIHCR